mmetsp:Transcript_1620/g.5004  ORF Transcript_1620/g.5004 Transcript_1620/m.5004 type:complete len:284 (+) Transcript_1620:198-1049(+)
MLSHPRHISTCMRPPSTIHHRPLLLTNTTTNNIIIVITTYILSMRIITCPSLQPRVLLMFRRIPSRCLPSASQPRRSALQMRTQHTTPSCSPVVSLRVRIIGIGPPLCSSHRRTALRISHQLTISPPSPSSHPICCLGSRLSISNNSTNLSNCGMLIIHISSSYCILIATTNSTHNFSTLIRITLMSIRTSLSRRRHLRRHLISSPRIWPLPPHSRTPWPLPVEFRRRLSQRWRRHRQLSPRHSIVLPSLPPLLFLRRYRHRHRHRHLLLLFLLLPPPSAPLH